MDGKWEIAGITIEGDADAQTAIRYIIFQLIVNCSARDDTVSIGARGLTHTRYKGCYFWDTDLFMLPFYLYTDPRGCPEPVQIPGEYADPGKSARKKNEWHRGALSMDGGP